MADFDSEDEMKDIALKVFGTPERELRRRNLHPGQPKKHDEEIDSELQQQPNGEEAQVDEELLPPPPPAPLAPRPSSPTPTVTDRIVAFLFHLAAAFFFIYMYIQRVVVLEMLKEEKGVVIPGYDTYGGQYKFLTFLNYIALIMYFVLALIVDVLPMTGLPQMEKFRDFIFTTIIFPSSLVVTILFWSMTIFLREISVGAEGSPMSVALKAIPGQINHSVHTAVGVAVVIETLLVYHRYSSNSDAFKTMFIWNSVYAIWVNWCYFYAGTLPYPMMVYLGPYLMNLMFLLFLTGCIVSYFFGKTVTSWSWAGDQ